MRHTLVPAVSDGALPGGGDHPAAPANAVPSPPVLRTSCRGHLSATTRRGLCKHHRVLGTLQVSPPLPGSLGGKQDCSRAPFVEAAGLGSVPTPWALRDHHHGCQVRGKGREPRRCQGVASTGPAGPAPDGAVNHEVFSPGPGCVPSGVSPVWRGRPKAPGHTGSEASLGLRGAPGGGRKGFWQRGRWPRLCSDFCWGPRADLGG